MQYSTRPIWDDYSMELSLRDEWLSDGGVILQTSRLEMGQQSRLPQQHRERPHKVDTPITAKE